MFGSQFCSVCFHSRGCKGTKAWHDMTVGCSFPSLSQSTFKSIRYRNLRMRLPQARTYTCKPGTARPRLVSCRPRCRAIEISLRQMPIDQELDVGISAYANNLPGFSAILKQRCAT